MRSNTDVTLQTRHGTACDIQRPGMRQAAPDIVLERIQAQGALGDARGVRRVGIDPGKNARYMYHKKRPGGDPFWGGRSPGYRCGRLTAAYARNLEIV
jgi:hypothetical protein